jgi:hypothetical protein
MSPLGLRPLVLVTVLLLPAETHAWPTADCVAGPFSVHGDLAAHVLDQPDIAPYLPVLGLSRDEIIAAAALEPTCFFPDHPGWGRLRDREHLGWPLADSTLGVILHVAGDSGVPACHSPASELYCSDVAETRVEADAELAGVPAFPGALAGTYDEQVLAFHDAQVGLTGDLQAYIAGNALCPALCDLSTYAVEGMENGQQLGHAALVLYLEPYAGLLPDGGVPDAGAPDAGMPDAGRADAGRLDAAPVDAARPDAGTSEPPTDPGCGCHSASRPEALWALLPLLVLVIARCRRRRAREKP